MPHSESAQGQLVHLSRLALQEREPVPLIEKSLQLIAEFLKAKSVHLLSNQIQSGPLNLSFPSHQTTIDHADDQCLSAPIPGEASGSLVASFDPKFTLQPYMKHFLEEAATIFSLCIERINSDQSLKRKLISLHIRDRQKDCFFASMVHELRNPLNSILGHLQMIKERPLGDAEVHRTLDLIEQSAQSESKLVSELLDIARLVNGKMNLHLAPINIGKLATLKTQELSTDAADKKVHLSFSIEGGEVWVEGDRDRLGQIVWNLVSNAIKFSNPSQSVKVALKTVGPNVELSITDEGIGIDSSELPFVFDRFWQSSRKVQHARKGLGLGLSIVKEIVELHGGKIHAESAGKGKGAKFIVQLPIWLVGYGPLKIKKGESLKMLVVDDCEDSLFLIHNCFSALGASVETCTSASEGLSRLKAEKFDLLISDLNMPGITGFDLIREWRKFEGANQASSLIAIAVSGINKSEGVNPIEAGFDFHMTKPLDFDFLRTAVATLLRRPIGSHNLQ